MWAERGTQSHPSAVCWWHEEPLTATNVCLNRLTETGLKNRCKTSLTANTTWSWKRICCLIPSLIFAVSTWTTLLSILDQLDFRSRWVSCLAKCLAFPRLQWENMCSHTFFTACKRPVYNSSAVLDFQSSASTQSAIEPLWQNDILQLRIAPNPQTASVPGRSPEQKAAVKCSVRGSSVASWRTFWPPLPTPGSSDTVHERKLYGSSSLESYWPLLPFLVYGGRGSCSMAA